MKNLFIFQISIYTFFKIVILFQLFGKFFFNFYKNNFCHYIEYNYYPNPAIFHIYSIGGDYRLKFLLPMYCNFWELLINESESELQLSFIYRYNSIIYIYISSIVNFHYSQDNNCLGKKFTFLSFGVLPINSSFTSLVMWF